MDTRSTIRLLASLLFLPLVAFGQTSVTTGAGGVVTGPSTVNFVSPKHLQVDGVNITASGGISSVSISNSIWVDAAGNNGTCAKGDLAKPCADLPTAASKVSAGDVIYVGPRVAPFDFGTTPFAIPANVAIVGAGADFTIITNNVAGATNRAGVEWGDGSALFNLTVRNTSSTGIPLGNLSSSGTFSSAFASGVKVVGGPYAIKISKTGCTGLQLDNVLMQTTGETVYQDVASVTKIKNSDIISDGTTTARSRGVFASAGTVTWTGGSIKVGNSTTNNVAAEASTTGSVFLHFTSIDRNATGTGNFDFVQSGSGTFGVEGSSRIDALAPRTTGTIVQLSRNLVSDNALQELTTIPGAIANAQDNLNLVPGTDVEVPLTASKSINRLGNDFSMVNDATSPGASQYYGTNSGGTKGYFDLPAGGGGGGGLVATVQNVGDANATINSGVTVVNLTTTLTGSRVLTLPAASTFGPTIPLIIVDTGSALNGARTISLARAGSDTIYNGSTFTSSNVVVLSANEVNGAVQILSDGTSHWIPITKGGGSRMTGYIDGTTPTLNNVLMGTGSGFASSAINRIHSVASATTLTPDFDSYDTEIETALAGNITVNAPTWTSALDGKRRMIRLTADSSGPYNITWNGTYTAIGVTLPATIAASKTIYVGVSSNWPLTRWDVLAVGIQP